MFPSYQKHYAKCKNIYLKSNPKSGKWDLYKFGLIVTRPGKKNKSNGIELPQDWRERVDKAAVLVDGVISGRDNRWGLESSGDFATRITNPSYSPEIEALAEIVIPQLEKHLFSSFVHLERQYIYRNTVSDSAPRSAWLWHYDHHPREMLKVMIALTDVNEKTGPMQYLVSPKGQPVFVIERPEWVGGRLPNSELEKYLSQGYSIESCTGPKGTVFVFDDNILHRATMAQEGIRDVIVFQVRPSSFKMRPHISDKWTGGFVSEQVSKDPEDYTPKLRQKVKKLAK